jgi:23S rRNA (uracil1939-C5)-methyltransferase
LSTQTVTIDSIGAKGDGLARQADGSRLIVPYALPGETVTIALQGPRADLVEIITPSPARVAPSCPHFGTCGGCTLQHWQPAAVADWKRERIHLALTRTGLSAPVEATLDAHGAGRRRVTLHIRRTDTGVVAGFMRAKSHDLIDLDACPLLVPQLAGAPDIARAIGHILRGTGKPLDLQVTACDEGLDCDIRGAGPQAEPLRKKLVAFAVEAGLARLTLHGERLVETRIPRIIFEENPDLWAFLPPGSFLQATARAEAELARLAGEALGGVKHVAELFCGLGPFGLRLSRRMKVSAFDADKPAIDAFQRSIRAHPGGKPITAEARDLFRRPLFAPELKPFDAVLLDPPRQGAEAQMREIAKSKLARVVYVSCDPESFARDAAILVEAGFRLGTVRPVDQFRHSAHVELVAEFTR